MFACSEVNAQSYQLKLQFNPADPSVLKKLKLPETYPNSISVSRKVSEILSFVRQNGYLLAEIKTIDWNNKHALVSIQLNGQFQLASLKNGNIPLELLQKSGYKEDAFSGGVYNSVQVENLIKDLLTAYENIGYPFASVFLDSVDIHENAISAKIFAVPGQLIQMDTLQLSGNVKISRQYLESYLNIKKDSPYNQLYIKSIEDRLQQLDFLKISKKPEVVFTANKAKVILYLERQNASEFDGVLGFLPDNNTGKLQLTGDIQLHLKNAFKRAESLSLSFKGLPGKSRELNLSTGLTELLNTPLGIDLSFNLFKQDTNFQNVNARGGINYRINKGFLNLFVTSRSGAPVGSTELNATELPVFASTKMISYGTGWLYNSLNSRIFPSKGILFQLEGEAGKKFIASNSIPANLKDSISLKTSQYRLKGIAEFYLQLTKRGVVKLGSYTGILLGRNFFENELYRIGGFNSLRGFDEQSILASKYSLFNMEYRFRIEDQSFLFAFYNQGLIRKSTVKESYKDTPLGFGAGINLETKAGLFSLSYALGKQRQNPLNLQRGKIHLGLITVF